MTITCLEFYSGIGGFAAAMQQLNQQATGPRMEIVAAIDIDRDAAEIYRRQYPGHAMLTNEIASFAVERYPAELWWLSPPCLPFTRKGQQRDRDDVRTQSLVTLLQRLESLSVRPRYLAIENVPPFADSQTGRWAQQWLQSLGFDTVWQHHCPTDDGVPMRRQRCFLLARDASVHPRERHELSGGKTPANQNPSSQSRQPSRRSLVDFLDPAADADPQFAVPSQWLHDYRSAIHVVDPRDPEACTACFTSSYTKQPIRSGSWLRRPPYGADDVRFFSPTEIVRLLGFAATFDWPESLRLRRRYALAGNSVHVPTVRKVVSQLLQPSERFGRGAMTEPAALEYAVWVHPISVLPERFMSSSFNTVLEAVEAIARGEVIIVVDAEDRENEGDFICAAEKVTPESINFMLGGRGQLCVAVYPEVCRRLDLAPLVANNDAPLKTAFMTPIDIRTAKTGITAVERCETIRRLAAADCQIEEFVRPGHVYPLLAKEGGVLRRAGHTEAAVDLAKMAGLAPAGALCEILASSGDRANREQLFALARQHDLKIISIEQLIAHRRVSEKLVSRTAAADLPTKYGCFQVQVYGVQFEDQEPIALVMGDLTAAGIPPLVRMHSSCFTGDLVSSLRCDCGDQLHMALKMISDEGRGALIYLPQEGRGIGLAQKIRAYALQDQGLDTVEANHALGFKADMRDYGVGLQILKDLGISEVRLLTNNPKKTEAFNLRGYDIRVVDQVPIVPPVNPHNSRYLETKRTKMGHQLPEQ